MSTGGNSSIAIGKRISVPCEEPITFQGAAQPTVTGTKSARVLALIRAYSFCIANLDDGLAFLWREGNMQIIAPRQSLAHAMPYGKETAQEETRRRRFRRLLSKYLAAREAQVGSAIHTIEVKPSDRIVIASDGLTGISESVIRDEVYKFDDPQTCAERLVRVALDSGSKDNVTCVVIYFNHV